MWCCIAIDMCEGVPGGGEQKDYKGEIPFIEIVRNSFKRLLRYFRITNTQHIARIHTYLIRHPPIGN